MFTLSRAGEETAGLKPLVSFSCFCFQIAAELKKKQPTKQTKKQRGGFGGKTHTGFIVSSELLILSV